MTRTGEKLQFICDSNRHMVCQPFSVDNLHRMAASLHIDRTWFFDDYYLIPGNRVQEMMALCEVRSPAEVAQIAGHRRRPSL
jgi:hypothetical protein